MLPYDAVARRTRLTHIQLCNLLRGVLGYTELPARDALVPYSTAMAVWLWDAMLTRRELPYEQQVFLFHAIWPKLQLYGEDLAQHTAALQQAGELSLPTMLLGIADDRWASVDDYETLDLITGEVRPTAELPQAPQRSVAYNLFAIFWGKYADYRDGLEVADHAAADA